MAYFGNARGELLHKGFCVLEGFLADDAVPEGELEELDSSGLGFFRNLHSAIKETFPGEEALRKAKDPHKSGWNYIFNQSEALDRVEAMRKGAGRYTMNNAGMTAFEQDKEQVWIARSHALLDVRMGQVMAALNAWDNRKAQLEKMFTPKSGGRWLYISKGCVRQRLHTDFALSDKSVAPISRGANPGFFTITTGPEEVSVWACPYSH